MVFKYYSLHFKDIKMDKSVNQFCIGPVRGQVSSLALLSGHWTYNVCPGAGYNTGGVKHYINYMDLFNNEHYIKYV